MRNTSKKESRITHQSARFCPRYNNGLDEADGKKFPLTFLSPGCDNLPGGIANRFDRQFDSLFGHP